MIWPTRRAAVAGVLAAVFLVICLRLYLDHQLDVVFAELPQSVSLEMQESLSPANLSRILLEKQNGYSSAPPFPHVYVDGMFPASLIHHVNAEVNHMKSGAFKNYRGTAQAGKTAVEEERRMGPATRMIFAAMRSKAFVQFLEKMSGITGLIPDPHYRGSGIHSTVVGGKLNIHADFNHYDAYNLERRVNTFVYLNPDWEDQWEGHLELWDRNLTGCHERIAPTFNRFVMFSSTDFSYHGHPQPLAAPEGLARNSIALYYYTRGRPQTECVNNLCKERHSTLFQTAKGTCSSQACNKYDTATSPATRT
ncbi:hypothetical protein B484DRAFT_457432 [Ochromonadaceae sp. CCMP2298]|nr:hypothetical protein B484DRAFT_457432 [Ochromonadaceae sp. CCMP2298]